MNISAPFVHRPIATSLLAAAILIVGIVAFRFLAVAPLPNVDFPTIQVSAALPGASPETMASSVATPLERRFGRIAGITEITSLSSLGNTSITLQFDLDRDVDAAARDVQAAINAAGGELPTNLPSRPRYGKVNPADAPIMILSLTSDSIPLPQLFDTANTVLAQKISQIEGVGQVFVGGGQQPAVRVQVDPQALAGVGLSLEDVRSALSTTNSNQPNGSVGDSYQSSSISSNSQLTNADGFRGTIISYQNGAVVRLSDLANVFDDVENNRAAAWTNGERSVLMIVRRQPGANIIDTIDRVRAVLPILATSISPAIKMEVASERSKTIRASVKDVEETLVISVCLVVAVVFVFLRSLRATAIPSVAVPLSLVGTFAVMYLLGYSLNNLSLMALTISTGFVVDDAIVVTENIARFIEKGESPMEAALKGARQIGFTIVSISVSLLAVFIPILLMGGVVGRLFREFAVTLSVAISVSAVVSLTLTPMMCSRLLRPEHGEKRGRLFNLSEHGFEWILARYGSGLRWVLRHRAITLIVTGLIVVLNVVLYIKIPKGLFPQQDTGFLIGFSEAAQDVSFPAMMERQIAVNNIVGADPDVSSYVVFTGGNQGSTANTGTVFIDLKPLDQRKSTADEVIARLGKKLAVVPGIRLFMQSVQDVRLGGRSARTQYQYTLQDVDIDELRIWAPKYLDAMRKLPQLRDVASDQQTQGLLLSVDIDRDTASRLGISMQAIDDTLYDALGQRQVSTIFTQLNQYRVVMEVKPEMQQDPEAIKSIFVRSDAGALVPFSAFATFTPQNTSLSINHQGQFPSVTISFNLAPDTSLGQAVEAIRLSEEHLGAPAGLHGSYQGTAQAFSASLKSQPYLILAALITVYIVLGVLYESYIHPVTILSTLPSAGVGALLALMAMKKDFSIIALIGIILLIGIVKKNAIMMVDFAIEAERDMNLSPQEAIYEACMLRFRPIMMTTLAALLGGVPLAIGSGMGAELRQPLGISIVGGLMVSQMLTLFTTPVVYLALDKFSRHRKARERLVVAPKPASSL